MPRPRAPRAVVASTALLLLLLFVVQLEPGHARTAFLPGGWAPSQRGAGTQAAVASMPTRATVVGGRPATAGMDASEFARAELARKQREYEASLKSRIQDQVRGDASAAAPALASLPTVPYLDQEGRVSPAGADAKVKASVYAVLDAEGRAQYIGVSRSVGQSLRLHLGRMPDKTYGFKVFHITKPSRALLEMTREAWIQELGAAPEGNDEGPTQALWENALDVKPLMTAEDHAALEDARAKQKSEENAMKKIARRFEAAKVEILEARGVTESLRFDPKLKAKGLLDLYIERAEPDSGVPEGKPGATGGK